MARFFLILLTSLLGIQQVQAEFVTVENSNDEGPELEAKEGETYRLVWKDGRKAKLISQVFDPVTFSIGLGYTKNTCASVPVPRCYIKTKVQLKKIMYVWEKNPVFPERVGKVLEKKQEDRVFDDDRGEYVDNPYFIEPLFITQYGQVLSRELGLNNVGQPNLKDLIVCDHFDWLPQSKGAEIVAQSWLSQFEFGVADFFIQGKEYESINQYTAGAKLVHLLQKNPGEVEVDYVELFNTSLKMFPSMALGYITEFSFDTTQYSDHPQQIKEETDYPNPTCKIQFTLQFSEIFQNFQSLDLESENPQYDPALVQEVKVDPNDPHQYLFRNEFEMEYGAD